MHARHFQSIHRWACALVLALCLMQAPVWAQQNSGQSTVYKWVDENGELHYGQTLPPEYKDLAHERLSNSGTVVDRTDRTLTPEERKALRDQEAVTRRLLAERDAREKKDRLLLAAYRSEQDILEVMGGEINVRSQPDQGSEFTFTVLCGLPDSKALDTETTSVARTSASNVLRNRNVLVAEDNPINQQLALEFLQRAGASVDIAETGRQAIAAATEGNYDVILMDIHMPQTDGLEATATIRAQGLTLPIIAVSADALAERKDAALQAGCDAYITKPIDFDLLINSSREE